MCFYGWCTSCTCLGAKNNIYSGHGGTKLEGTPPETWGAPFYSPSAPGSQNAADSRRGLRAHGWGHITGANWLPSTRSGLKALASVCQGLAGGFWESSVQSPRRDLGRDRDSQEVPAHQSVRSKPRWTNGAGTTVPADQTGAERQGCMGGGVCGAAWVGHRSWGPSPGLEPLGQPAWRQPCPAVWCVVKSLGA